MESGRRVRLYVSNVCFRNMGRQDSLFNMFGGKTKRDFAAYLLCCAFADSSETYRSLVENWADAFGTGIEEMKDLTEGDPAMLASLKHIYGIYTDGNVFSFPADPGQAEKPYRKPAEMPDWHVAYVKMQDGTGRHYYSLAPADLVRVQLRLFAERYALPLADIVSVRPVLRNPAWYASLAMRMLGARPGHMLTNRMLRELMNGRQDMGLYAAPRF